MIYLYSGTPGSGKSYHAVLKIYNRLRMKKNNNVIANFNLSLPSGVKGNFIYLDNSEFTIDYLLSYAKSHHQIGFENQTLVVCDEAQILFNCRDWGTNSKIRMQWIEFFSQHRKYGFNFIMIAQFDKMIDKQIRYLIEYEILHMKMNNFFSFIPVTFFLCVQRWYGQRMKIGHEVIPYRKKIAKLYNSYMTFEKEDASQQRSVSEECCDVSSFFGNEEDLDVISSPEPLVEEVPSPSP